MRSEKLDPTLREMIDDPAAPEILPVIIQTEDGLKPEDKTTLTRLKGVFKDDLHIINAFSANLPRRSLDTLILSPRVVKVYFDGQVHSGGE